MKKRILYFMFALFLVTSNVAEVHAEAGILTIIGGSIATGGLTGEALVSAVAPYMAPVLLGIMVAGGLNVYLTEQSQAAGMTKTEYLTNKVRAYCDAAGKPIDKFWGDFANGCTVAQNGTIAIGEQARTQVKQFLSWLQQSDNVTQYNPSQAGGNEQIKINDKIYPVGQTVTITYTDGTVRTYTCNQDVAVGITEASNWYYVVMFARSKVTSSPSLQAQPTVKGYYSVMSGRSTSYGMPNISVGAGNVEVPLYVGTTYNFLNSLDGSFDVETAVQSPTQDTVIDTTGNGVGVTDNALSPSAGATPVLNPGLIDGIDLEGLAGVTSTVQEYLDALRDVLDGVRDPAITGEREDTGEKDTIAIDEDDVADPAIDPVLDPDLPPVKTPVVDPNSEPTGENAVRPLTIDLKTVFPFCLPFDAYKMLQKLNASAVAPNYQVNWYIPIVNQTLSFNVDLSSFDSVAEVLRNLELIAFCIGLAIVTRNIIRS